MKKRNTNERFYKKAPNYLSKYRTNLVLSPEVIRTASGIIINGRRYKSFLFSSDVATIMYNDADAVLAVYPYSVHTHQLLGRLASSPNYLWQLG